MESRAQGGTRGSVCKACGKRSGEHTLQIVCVCGFEARNSCTRPCYRNPGRRSHRKHTDRGEHTGKGLPQSNPPAVRPQNTNKNEPCTPPPPSVWLLCSIQDTDTDSFLQDFRSKQESVRLGLRQATAALPAAVPSPQRKAAARVAAAPVAASEAALKRAKRDSARQVGVIKGVICSVSVQSCLGACA